MVWRVPVKALEKHYLNQYMKNEWSQFCMWLRAGDFAQENPHCRGQILCLSCISELITNFELPKLSYECQNIVGCFHLPVYMVPPCGHWEWGRSVFLSPSQQENYKPVGRTLTCWRGLLLIQRNVEPSFQVRITCDQRLESVRAEGPVPFAAVGSSCR